MCPRLIAGEVCQEDLPDQCGTLSSTAGVSPAELQMIGSLSRLALTISIEIWARPYVANKL